MKKISTGHISISWKNMKIGEKNLLEMAGLQIYFLSKLDTEVLLPTQPLFS